MPKIEPVGENEIQEILGQSLFRLWQETVETIENLYDVGREWHTAGKAAKYELKFRKSGKTLVSMFPKESSIGVMIIFGKDERSKFEEKEWIFSEYVKATYHDAKTYRDGKWVMFNLPSDSLIKDLPEMLLIKRKTTKKERS